MIELIVADRCTDCGVCVVVCPRDVFERDRQGRAVIARQADCQTCFLCELYCPVDALYVGPDCDRSAPVELAEIESQLGRFRRHSGWGEWAETNPNEHWRMGEIFQRARTMAASRPSSS